MNQTKGMVLNREIFIMTNTPITNKVPDTKITSNVSNKVPDKVTVFQRLCLYANAFSTLKKEKVDIHSFFGHAFKKVFIIQDTTRLVEQHFYNRDNSIYSNECTLDLGSSSETSLVFHVEQEIKNKLGLHQSTIHYRVKVIPNGDFDLVCHLFEGTESPWIRNYIDEKLRPGLSSEYNMDMKK